MQNPPRTLVFAIASAVVSAVVLVTVIMLFESRPASAPPPSPFQRVAQ